MVIRLKDARNKAGMTQRQAAEKSGIPLGTLRRWEQGVNEPDTDSIIRLADLYGVSTDEMLGSSFAPKHEDAAQIVLTDEEQQLVDLYRMSNPQGREAIMAVARASSGVERQPSAADMSA